MSLSRCWGKTRRETLKILEEDHEEYIWQIAANHVDPLPDFNELFALILETQVQEPKKRFDHTRHLPVDHPLRRAKQEAISSKNLKLYLSGIGG